MKRSYSAVLLCSLCIAPAACGSSSSGNEENVSSTGDFGKDPFAARGGAASVLKQTSSDGEHSILRIWLMDTENVCANSIYRKSSKALQMDVLFPANTDPQPGNYVVGRGNGASTATTIFRSNRDAACIQSEEGQAQSGKVSIAIVNDTLLEGTFSAAFEDASISGTFQIPICPQADANQTCH